MIREKQQIGCPSYTRMKRKKEKSKKQDTKLVNHIFNESYNWIFLNAMQKKSQNITSFLWFWVWYVIWDYLTGLWFFFALIKPSIINSVGLWKIACACWSQVFAALPHTHTHTHAHALCFCAAIINHMHSGT